MTQNTEPSKLSDTRPPSLNADEPTTLLAFLDYLRDGVIAKVDGLSDEDARRPGVASGTSLLWLVRHLTAVEHNWFAWAYQGEPEGPYDVDRAPLDGVTVAGQVAAYREAIARSNRPGPRPAGRALAAAGRRRGAVAALGAGPHDRGDRAARRARGHHPRAAGRRGRALTAAEGC